MSTARARLPVRWAIATSYFDRNTLGAAVKAIQQSIAFFGQQAWSTLVMILTANMFPRSAAGSVAGLVVFGGAMVGVVFGKKQLSRLETRF